MKVLRDFFGLSGDSKRGSDATFSKGDRILLIGFFVAVLILSVRTIQCDMLKLMWFDEILSWWVCIETTWEGMWNAMRLGVDGMLPAFYLQSWVLAKLFGSSSLMLRLPSLIWGLVGFGMVFVVLQQAWGRVAAVAGMTLAVFTNSVLQQQLSEFRGYGMLMGLVGILFAQIVWLSSGRGPRRLYLVGTCLMQALLWLTHPFGVLYGGAMIGGKVAIDVFGHKGSVVQRLRSVDWYLLLTALPAVVLFLLWFPTYSKVSDLTKPWGHILVPGVWELASLFLPQIGEAFPLIVLAVSILVLLLMPVRDLVSESTCEDESKRQLQTATLWLSISMLGVGPIVWIVSQVSQPIFAARYFIPSSYIWATCFAALWNSLGQSRFYLARAAAWVAIVGGSLFVGGKIVVDGIIRSDVSAQESADQRGENDGEWMPEPIPILFEESLSFMTRDHYNPLKRSYYMVLNPDVAAADRTQGIMYNSATKCLLRLRETNYPKSHIVTVKEVSRLIKKWNAFYLVEQPAMRVFNFTKKTLLKQGWQVSTIEVKRPEAIRNGVILKFTRPSDKGAAYNG